MIDFGGRAFRKLLRMLFGGSEQVIQARLADSL